MYCRTGNCSDDVAIPADGNSPHGETYNTATTAIVVNGYDEEGTVTNDTDSTLVVVVTTEHNIPLKAFVLTPHQSRKGLILYNHLFHVYTTEGEGLGIVYPTPSKHQ